MIEQILREAMSGERSKAPCRDPQEIAAAAESFQKKHTFKPGDFITQKACVRKYKAAEHGYPVQVLRILDAPVIESKEDTCDAYYGLENDIEIGSITPKGGFVTFVVQSQLFEPWDESMLPPIKEESGE